MAEVRKDAKPGSNPTAQTAPIQPEVSVVVPCKGPADLLADLLGDLTRQETDYPYEVIVVDAGIDEAVWNAAAAAGTRPVRGDGNLLPGAARNFGAEVARGTILAFVDADCRADPGWLEAAVDTLAAGARIATGPVSDLWPFHLVARADNLLQFADLPKTRPAGTLHMAPTCNFAIRREDFDRLGGFVHRKNLPTGEDVDFCQRVTEQWPDRIHFAPDMVVRHLGRRTLPEMTRHHHAFGYSRGRLKLLLTDRQARLAGLAIMVPAVVLRRMVYITGRVARFNRRALPLTIVISPLLLIGLAAWTAGFRRGLAEDETPETDQVNGMLSAHGGEHE